MTTTNSISHEYATDEILNRQIKTWQKNDPIHLIANAMPDGVLVLNEQRQVVFANQLFLQIAKVDSFDLISGKRPGEIFYCVNADLTPSGCGSSTLCKYCGAHRAIISSLFGKAALEECHLERKFGLEPLDLRVKTTPVELENEKFTIFAIEDISIERERDKLMEELKLMSETDELTELYNRRFLYEEAERELARAQRYHHPISFFMVDIDHFKQVNDTYGHLMGDKVLVEFAKTVRDSLRKMDLIVRWGGEEFVILLPEADKEQACIAAQRLLTKVAEMTVETEQGDISITISIGTTGIYAGEEITFDEVMKQADDAVYLAKDAGRNCVVHWDTKKVCLP